MVISKQLWEKALSQWNEVKKMTDYTTFNGVTNLFPSNDVTNKTEEFIDVNYKDILVTLTKGAMGNAVLSDSFEIYNENGVFVGQFFADKPPYFEGETKRVEKYVEDGEVDWGTEFGVYGVNRDTRICENTSYLINTTIVVFDSEDPSFDECDVSNEILKMGGREDYDLYDGQHYLVGYAYIK